MIGVDLFKCIDKVLGRRVVRLAAVDDDVGSETLKVIGDALT